MSQVKNDSNPVGNFFGSIGKEIGRAASEATRHVTESINEVTKAMSDGGFVAGGLAAMDKLSQGTFFVGVLDSIIPGADLPKPLAEGLAGAVNLLSGNPVGLYDIYQAFSAAGGDGGKSAPANDGKGQPTQTPESPARCFHRHWAHTHDEAPKTKKEALERTRQHSQEKTARYRDMLAEGAEAVGKGGGYAVIESMLEDMGGVPAFLEDAVADLTTQAKANDALKKKLAKMEKESKEAIAELDKILNNPNLSFEDMIFMLMGALMKQSQKDVKGMTAQVREDKIAADKTKRELAADFDVKEAKVLDLEAKVRKDPNNQDLAKQLNDAKSELRKSGDARSDQISEANDSRQEQLEAIKNAMNKITEMQQTLSSILNSMHQTAMSTIGNIR